MELHEIGDTIQKAVEEALAGIDVAMVGTWIGCVSYSAVIDDEVERGFRLMYSDDNEVHTFSGMASHLFDHFADMREEMIVERED